MATKRVQMGIETRKALLAGALTAAKTIGVTFGPAGRTVMLDRPAGLLSTRDGVTVARELTFEDPEGCLGAKILTDACVTVNDQVGDGTTTTAILAAELLAEGHKLIVAGYAPMQVAAGMQGAAACAVAYLTSIAEPVTSQEQLETVALLASNGDAEIAKLLAEASMAVGKDGSVIIEDGHGTVSTLELKEGMEIDRGAVTSAFFLGPTLERKMTGPLVAVINRVLRTMDDVKEILEVASQWQPRELLVVAQGIEGDALAAMTLNNAQGVVKSCGVLTPGFGPTKTDWLRDVAALAGATFVDPEAGHDVARWDAEWFGALREAIILPNKSTLIAYEDNTADLSSYMAGLRARMGSTGSEYDRDKLKERLAKLSGGLAIIRVGGVTEPAMKERRARVEDALGSLRAALRGGLVPGAGTSFLLAADDAAQRHPESPEAYCKGWGAVLSAFQAPLRVLATNAGADGAYIANQVEEQLTCKRDSPWVGYDALTGTIRDLRADPKVLNPMLVDTAAITAAASVASTLLTVEASLTLSDRDGR
jgi:chaperonin GroEL